MNQDFQSALDEPQAQAPGAVGGLPVEGDNYVMSKDDPRASGNGTYDQGCLSCGAVAPIAAGTAEHGYECGNCNRGVADEDFERG